MDSPVARSTVIEAVDSFARELPFGPRRHELMTLVKELETPSASAPIWTKAFAKGLNLLDSESSLTLWINEASYESRLRAGHAGVWWYPLCLFGLVGTVMLLAGPMILEPFRQMFDEFGLTLPVPTSALLYVGKAYFGSTIRGLVTLFSVGFMGCVCFWLIRRYSPFSRFCFPLVAGNSVSVSAMASFTAMLSHLLRGGEALPDALEDASDACGHNYTAMIGRQLAAQARDGKGPLRNCAAAKHFPSNLIQAIEPMDRAIPNHAMLTELSTMYQERVEARAEDAGGAVGILGILVVGGLVAFVVFALFMPLVELVSGLAGP